MSLSIGCRICCVLFLLAHLGGCSSPPQPPPSDPVESLATADAFARKYGVIRDPRVEEYLGYLNSRLSRVLTAQYRSSFSFLILDTPELFAVSTPSGVIMISRGLFAALPVEGELAFVLAHEMSHVVLRHHLGLERQSSADGGDLFTSYSPEVELAADLQGQGIMALAGYDPRVATSSIVRLARHPALRETGNSQLTTSRIGQLDRAVVESGWRPPGTIDRRDFQTVRRLLASHPPHS